ncbi:MAG: DUF3800 domain-containing protein [bacterium]
MWYLYLDESGDLGFDFVNKKPSKFFTICVLATSNRESFIGIGNSVKKTIKRKVNINSKKNFCYEFKGSNTNIEVKRYFWELVKDYEFKIYTITLNKRRVYERLTKHKERIYNFIAREVMDRIPLEKADTRIQLVVDKSKAKPEIKEFNRYIFSQLEGRLDPKISLYIDHLSSKQDPVLQATDVFAWGIFRKYEKKDKKWFDYYKEKILFDEQYL